MSYDKWIEPEYDKREVEQQKEVSKTVHFMYTNHKGVYSPREVIPVKLWFGSTEYHKDCYLLKAFDVDKQAERDFDMSKIEDWRNNNTDRGIKYFWSYLDFCYICKQEKEGKRYPLMRGGTWSCGDCAGEKDIGKDSILRDEKPISKLTLWECFKKKGGK